MQGRETSGRRGCGHYDPDRDHSGGGCCRGLVAGAVLRFAAEGCAEEQRERSREEFGSEYERTAQERGSEEEAERELRERRGRVERRVEPLSQESRGRYEEQWGEVERVFVNNPERSIELADRTVSDILNERNFVSDAGQSDEETERSLAAMHPDVADDYREARGHQGRSRGAFGRARGRRVERGVHRRVAAGHPQVSCGLRAARDGIERRRGAPATGFFPSFVLSHLE